MLLARTVEFLATIPAPPHRQIVSAMQAKYGKAIPISSTVEKHYSPAASSDWRPGFWPHPVKVGSQSSRR